MRGVYHRAGPPGPASGRPDGKLRPDTVDHCAPSDGPRAAIAVCRTNAWHIALPYGEISCCCPSLLVNFKDVVAPLAPI